MQKPTVACVYVPGNGFDIHYVERLYAGFQKQKTPHKFVCLTTDPEVIKLLGVENTHFLNGNLEGWWNKIELFRPTRFNGRVVYCDLDCVITGELEQLLTYDEKRPLFLDDFYHKGNLASGVMSFNAQDMDFVWHRFVMNRQRILDACNKGRLGNIGDQAYLRTLFPEGAWGKVQDIQKGIYSYKVDVRGKGVPEDAAMVMFHGNPRPHEVQL